jgi:hypothetical protein
MVRMFAGFALLMMPGVAASAQDSLVPAAAGNLPADFYAKSGCARPDVPLNKPPRSDQAAVDAYNAKVRRYNVERLTFDTCINAYVEKTDRDIEWIVFAVNTAVAKVNGSNPPSVPLSPGNMPAGFYPAPACIFPAEKVDAAPDPRNAKAMEAHNTKVRTFNALAGSFGDCIADYKTRAEADIARIEAAQNAAALEAKNQ